MRAVHAMAINAAWPADSVSTEGESPRAAPVRCVSLAALAEDIRRIEGGFGHAKMRRHISTALPALDERLPGGGLAGGALHEFVAAAEGCGLRTWTLWLASRAATGGGYILWLDSAGDFYPPAAWAWGIDPQRLVLVRPRDRKDTFWAMDQALRCRGVAAVAGAPGPLTRAEARRLQLAAEAGGGVGLLLAAGTGSAQGRIREGGRGPAYSVGVASRWRIAPMAGGSNESSFAFAPGEESFRVSENAGKDSRGKPVREGIFAPAPKLESRGQRFTVEVLRCRGGHAVAPILLEVSRESGLVAVSAGLADRSSAAATEPARSPERTPRRVRSA